MPFSQSERLVTLISLIIDHTCYSDMGRYAVCNVNDLRLANMESQYDFFLNKGSNCTFYGKAWMIECVGHS